MTTPASAWQSATPTALGGGTSVNASLSVTGSGSPSDTVSFQFNPQKIAISHSAKLQEITPPKKSQDQDNQPSDTGDTSDQSMLGYEDRIKAVGATTISLSDLTFSGKNVLKDCARLLGWTYAKFPQQGKAPALPKLTFSWGPLSYSVILMQADVSYEHFTPSGTPIRAKVNLRLQSIVVPLAGTNPTSGGIPGRRSHTLVAGENLQQIATASYGRPGAWRALADANGIEDPLAVQPGMLIYLPAPDELAGGAPR
jgi:nucleoid-associated protein YgaU